ncbi:4-hydroxy-tetrahydrodipicolinate reductase [Thermocrinis sp.]
MTKVILCGALGRMGRAILKSSLEYADVEVVAGVEHPDCVRDQDLGKAVGMEELAGKVLTSRLEEVLPLGDVVVDFTGNTLSALAHAKLSAYAKKAVVVGTTGFPQEQVEELKELSQLSPILLSPNMSLGVNLLFKLAEIAVKALKDKNFDVEILEIHHRFKKDAPSGTALKLLEVSAKAMGKEPSQVGKFGREGIEPREEEIGVMSLRGGDVVGEHTLYLIGFGERIELTHRATSRSIFAKGALEACRWIKGKPPGFYSMFDVLGI